MKPLIIFKNMMLDVGCHYFFSFTYYVASVLLYNVIYKLFVVAQFFYVLHIINLLNHL